MVDLKSFQKIHHFEPNNMHAYLKMLLQAVLGPAYSQT